MNIRIKRTVIALLLSLLLPVSMSVPVLARDGIETSTNTSGSGTSGGGGTSGGSTTEPKTSGGDTKPETTTETADASVKTEAEVQHESEMEKEAETKIHDSGKELLAEAKKSGKEHTKDERLKNCTEQQKGLQTKLTNLQNNSKKHLNKINAVLAKIVDSQKGSTTPIANYDSLLATAKTAHTQATASVAALGTLSVTIDCSKDTAASDIATFKAAANLARTDLKSFRDSVKAILASIETAEGAN